MAKIQSATITNASGSIGGMTFAKNRGGLYLRARAAVTNPQTAGQTLIRTTLSNISTLWRTLTEVQRQGWSDWAAVNPRTNAFGDPLTLTGHQVYIAFNTPRLQAGLARVDDSPVAFGLPVTPVTTGVAPTLVIADPNVTLTVPTKNGEPQDGDLLLYVSLPQSPSTKYFKGPYNLMGTTPIASESNADAVANQTSLPAVAAGQVLWWRIRSTMDDGRLSGIYSGFVVATEAP